VGSAGVRYVYDDNDDISMEERRAMSKKYANRDEAKQVDADAVTDHLSFLKRDLAFLDD